jgi:anti-sigma factor RsiW
VADHLAGGLRCADVVDLAPSFVLGALAPRDADAVRRHLAGCPEAHAEVAELGSVVPALFEAVDLIEPPSSLRDRIMVAAAAEHAHLAGRPAVADATPVRPPGPADTRPDPLPPRATDRGRSGGRWTGLFGRPVWAAAAVAAALALVALGAWNLQLRDEIAGLTAYRNGVAAVLEQAAQPGAQLAVLASSGATAGPSGLAAVAGDGSVALVMRDLAPTTGTQVYEAWLIGADGKPLPIGGFRVGSDGSAAFAAPHAPLGSGVVVALTLEPGPGATTPTEPIIAAGTAAAQSS